MSEPVSPAAHPLDEIPPRDHARPTDRLVSFAKRWLSAALSQGTAMPAIASLVIIAVFFQSQSQYFLSPGNLSNLAVQATLVAIIALGEIFVLLLGDIDLSLGSMAGASAALLGVMITNGHMPWLLAIFIMLAFGALLGSFQGWWIAWLGIPAFVVTLAGNMGFLGLQLYILGPNGTLGIFDPNIAALSGTELPVSVGWILAAIVGVAVVASTLVRYARGGVAVRSLSRPVVVGVLIVVAVAVFNASRGVPTPFLILIALLVVAWWVTMNTSPGRHLFAVGGNAEAARRAGVQVKRIRMAAFAVSGTLGAAGGLIAASYNGSAGTLTGGGTLLLEAIGAAVIIGGGTSLFGGRGSVWAALVGALIMSGVENGLDLMNSDQPVKYMVQGVIVLLAVSLDTILRRRQSRGRQLGAAIA
jgi:ABC-type xylose transport system, permease component